MPRIAAGEFATDYFQESCPGYGTSFEPRRWYGATTGPDDLSQPQLEWRQSFPGRASRPPELHQGFGVKRHERHQRSWVCRVRPRSVPQWRWDSLFVFERGLNWNNGIPSA